MVSAGHGVASAAAGVDALKLIKVPILIKQKHAIIINLILLMLNCRIFTIVIDKLKVKLHEILL